MADTPVFYSFRRCPYAIRARLALDVSHQQVHLREVVLRDKPQAFLEASPSGTVPCLVTSGHTIDESLDVMLWALQRADPEGWLRMPDTGFDWIARCDGPFKHALDRTKYATRYPDEDARAHRTAAEDFLSDLDTALTDWIYDTPTLADFAILPFVRQFAFIDKDRFDAYPWPNLHNWLTGFLTSDRFGRVMHKYPQWQPGDAVTVFPA